MIPDIQEYRIINGVLTEGFPSYATLHEATVSFEEMGSRTIRAQVKIDGNIVPDFAGEEWALKYRDELFVLNTHCPQARKDTTTRCSLFDLVFESQAIFDLKRYFFVELAQVQTNTVIINRFVCPLRLKAEDFIVAFNGVLRYYFGDTFTIVVDPTAEMPQEVMDVDINYTYLWEALANLYNVYKLVWRIEAVNGGYRIIVGDAVSSINDHTFQYGYSGGLQSIERQIEDAEIYNRLFGRGGEKNLPYRYFKKADPNNEYFAGDPDACAELANVYFDRLLDSNFRYYVKGWLRNPNRTPSSDYPVPTDPEPADVQAHWAYQKGLTDAGFDPVEYVEDTESIAEYGVRHGKLEDNDEIYPTIQGVEVAGMGRVDEIVAVGPITDDDETVGPGGVTTQELQQMVTRIQNYNERGIIIDNRAHYDIELLSDEEFTIPANCGGTVSWAAHLSADTSGAENPASVTVSDYKINVSAVRSDGEEISAESLIPGGATYRLKVVLRVDVAGPSRKYRRTVGIKDITLTTQLVSNFDTNANPYTFNVWVKNIWETSKLPGENDIQYAERVWLPILGDRVGNEAAIVFSDGWMSASSDYEFKIVEVPAFDQSKTIDGVPSEWRLTLAKSDAEMQATGKMFPSADSTKPVAGDHFFFVGIDMPHKYVEWAEKRLNEAKQAALDEKAYANPTWAVELDYVRVHTLEGSEVQTLLSRMDTGIALRIFDPRFSGGQVLQLAIRALSITWSDSTVMKPSVTVTLSENVLERIPASQDLSYPVIQARIRQAAQQIATSIWIEGGAPEAMSKSRAVASGSTPYLSKTYEDIAYGKVGFLQGATFGEFVEGLTGTGAQIDADGHGEMDSLTLRKFLEVPELRFNRTDIQVGNNWRAPGGGLIEHVEIDYDGDTQLNTGTIFLKMEDGETASVAVGDICMGIFHNESGNAAADADDSRGNFQFAGFSTCYFWVTEILAEDNHIFKYALRPTSANWSETNHPQASMTYVAYGNFSNTARQTSRYSTRTYERYLKGVNGWEITSSNIAAQFGDLSNLTVFGLNMAGYSAYLENIYMTGYLKQTVNPPEKRVDIDTQGRTALALYESLTLTATAMQGWDNIGGDVTDWAITRDSGNPLADMQWAQQLKVTTFDGTIVLENVPAAAFPDFPDTAQNVAFTVSATFSDNSTASSTVVILRLDESSDGEDAILVTLDHYSDIMTYDTAGTRLSDPIVITAKLRKGGEDVPNTAITWSHSPTRSGITRSDNVVTVSSMSAAAENITISAYYDGVLYSAVFSLKKLIVGDTYEIVATPSALTYNTTTQTGSANAVTFEVYKNTQGLNGEMTRTMLTSLDSSVYRLDVNGTNVTSSYGATGYTLSNIPFSRAALSATLYRLQAAPASNIRLASVEVPIAKVENGAPGTPGQDGDDGEVGVTYRISVFEAGKTYRNDIDGPAQDGLRIVDVVYDKNIAMLSDPNLNVYQCVVSRSLQPYVSQAGDLANTSLWTNINQLNLPLATPLLLANKIVADYIDVDSLDTKLLTIKSSATAPSAPPSTCVGRMGDTNYYTVDGTSKKFPLWIGGQYPYSSGTKFKVDGNGNIYASGGQIGGFSINTDNDGNLKAAETTSSQANVYLNLRAGQVIYSGARLDGATAGSFSDRLGFTAAQLNAMTTSSSVILHETTLSYERAGTKKAYAISVSSGATNYGLDISVSANSNAYGAKIVANGNSTNYGLHISASGGTSNYAIYCPNGVFAGLRPQTRRIYGSGETLTELDYSVVVANTSAWTLNLPSSPRDGQTYHIHHTGTASSVGDLTIKSGTSNIYYLNGTSSSARGPLSEKTSTNRELIILTYFASWSNWVMNLIHL